jgi:hypothetical protein
LHPPRPADYLPCVRSLPLFLPLLPLVAAIHLTAPALRASAPPDPETGFRARADQILSARADEDGRELIDWARRIKLGDPHKYLFPVILAKAWRDPKDPVAWDMARFLRDVDQEKAKGDRGLYHFAAIGLTRLQFGFEKELPEDLRAWYAENAGGNLGKFRAGGTENHGMMSRTSGYVFAERFQKERGGPPESDHLAYFRAFLEREGRKLYTIGMGEWDSSTYVAFSLAGWMNVYDFAQDPEARALAKAALDWYASMMALKQFHGVHAGCEARGFANRPVDTQTDIISWLWWGTAPEGFKPDLVSNKGGRYAVIAALSGYRPPAELTALARKEVALPFQARMSKPSYYGYSEDNVSQEILWSDAGVQMSTLYDPTPGNRTTGTIWPQTTMFKLAVLTPGASGAAGDVKVFGIGNGYHRHFPVEGRSAFDQFHQEKGAAINLCYLPPPEQRPPNAVPESYLAIPDGIEEVARGGGWIILGGGNTLIAVYPLGGEPEPDNFADWAGRTGAKPKEGAPPVPGYRALRLKGDLTGWVVQVKSGSRDAQALLARLKAECPVNTSKLLSHREVSYRSLDGPEIRMVHTGGPGGKPRAWTGGKELEFSGWPVFDSPALSLPLRSGVIKIGAGEGSRLLKFPGSIGGDPSDAAAAQDH